MTETILSQGCAFQSRHLARKYGRSASHFPDGQCPTSRKQRHYSCSTRVAPYECIVEHFLVGGKKKSARIPHCTIANLSSAPERSSAEDWLVALTQQARQGGGVERGTFHFYNYQSFITYAPPHRRAPILLSLPGLSKATSFETICRLSDRQGKREGSACFHPIKNHTLTWLRPQGPMGGLYCMTEQSLVPRVIYDLDPLIY